MTAIGDIRMWLLAALLTFAAACGNHPADPVSDEQPQGAATPSMSVDEPTPTAWSTGQNLHVSVPSHCGVLSLWVNGRLWLADPPLGQHNPPPGWDENTTTGRLLKTGPGRAVFTGEGGQEASFERAPRGAEDPNAGCE
jgi:hypothetical protein